MNIIILYFVFCIFVLQLPLESIKITKRKMILNIIFIITYLSLILLNLFSFIGKYYLFKNKDSFIFFDIKFFLVYYILGIIFDFILVIIYSIYFCIIIIKNNNNNDIDSLNSNLNQ